MKPDIANEIANEIAVRFQAKAAEMLIKYQGKNACSITNNEEAMAIAWAMGADMEIDCEHTPEKEVLRLTTKNPCGVIWTGKEFHFATITSVKSVAR